MANTAWEDIAGTIGTSGTVLIELITTMKKVSRCVYWEVKNTEE